MRQKRALNSNVRFIKSELEAELMQEIIIENKKIKSEFDRWSNIFGLEDPYDSQETVGLKDVLRAHFLIADYFYTEDYGLGGVGPKDQNLLHSAIYRQFVSFDGVDKWKNSYERCATLVFGIVKDHPFHDANKRTALLTLLHFLSKMKRFPTVKQIELEDLIVDLAENNLRKHRRFIDLSKNGSDPEVYFLSDYLRRNSRAMDTSFKSITYNQLNQCLKRHGYYLDNIKNGTIELCRDIEKRRHIFAPKELVQERVLPSISFQKGWKSQASKAVVTRIREAAKLNVANGIDSAIFFGEVDPLYSLIDEYRNPLQRLADR